MKFGSLIMAASAASLVHASSSSSTKRDAVKKRANGFTWVGANESGAEFGETNIPGKLGTDYTWPNASSIQTLRDAGMNIFRVPFLMERLVPDDMTGTPDATYLKALKSTVQSITEGGAYAVLDPHNYGRYSGNIISSTSNFQSFWKTVAGEFSSNEKVIFDTNNEYHDIDQSLVLKLNQAAINGIRAAGAKTQYIFVEGNSYSGAWKWADTNDNLKGLTDPQDKIVYEMHQYLDSDGSGTSETCVSSTIGKERLQTATQWLKDNNKKGFLGEFAGGVNKDCETAVEGLLSYMSDNSEVWMGAEWWAAGPWWGDYMYNLEPKDGQAYSTYLPILKKYFVSDSSTTSASSADTKVKISTPSTPSSQPVFPSTTPAVPTPSVPSSASIYVPTTFLTASSSSIPSSTSSVPAASSSGLVNRYYQCGGQDWTGPTTCQSPYTCVKQNTFYSQCM